MKKMSAIVVAIALLHAPVHAFRFKQDTEAELTSRIGDLCASMKDVDSGAKPLSAGPAPWAAGTSAAGRINVPPGDPDYAAVQNGVHGDIARAIGDLNGRMQLLGKPALNCQ